MVKIENECCDCATETYPCIGDACPNRHVKRFYCDECGEEETLYEFDGEQLCIGCITLRLNEVTD